MVVNYSNPNGGTGRNIDQSTRRKGGIKMTSTENEGASTTYAECWLQADGSQTGNLQCHAYALDGTQLSQIGGDVDISTLTSSFVKYTFTASLSQQDASTFPSGETGFIAWSISGSGKCNIEVQNTGNTTPRYSALPYKYDSSGNWVLWDSSEYYYVKGVVNQEGGSSGGVTVMPPPYANIGLHGL